MAEIRINATGGVKLYDADDSHYAQIVAGTITSNVDAITLGHDVVSIVDNLALTSDSAVLKFGADNDTTLTHTDGTGLTLNSTNKLCFQDTGTYVGSNADGDIDVVSDGTAVDSINLESAGGITLDAGTASSGVIYEDDGTEMLRIHNSSSDVIVESKVSDKDIIIKGNDGGSTVTALTLDMSAAGDATFNNDIISNTGSVRNRPNAKPIIYNGDMQVSQRTASETGITDNRYSACDRYKIEIDSCGTWTVIQETLTSGNAYDDGFRKALRLDCTTADASPASADAVVVSHRLEGQDLNVFKKGTSSAETYTLAFWIKSDKTGTAQVNLQDQENTRMCSGQYTISSTNTWEKKVINFAADTSGASNNDNTEFIRICWFFDAGSNYTSGAVPTAWEAMSAGDKSVSDLAIADSTSNDVAITGVQLEVGTYTAATLPPFQHESWGDNVQRCKRYFNSLAHGADPLDAATGQFFAMGQSHSSTSIHGVIVHEPEMRTTPSLEVSMGTNYMYRMGSNGEDYSDNFETYSTQTRKSLSWKMDDNVSTTQGDACQVAMRHASGYIWLNAEL